jgi:hypothetical protein
MAETSGYMSKLIPALNVLVGKSKGEKSAWKTWA